MASRLQDLHETKEQHLVEVCNQPSERSELHAHCWFTVTLLLTLNAQAYEQGLGEKSCLTFTDIIREVQHLVDLCAELAPALTADVAVSEAPLVALPPAAQPLAHLLIPDDCQNSLPAALLCQQSLLWQDGLHTRSR